MAVVRRNLNRIMPANSRSVKVAQRAIKELTPVFQEQYTNAFRVQGSPGILYSRLQFGEPCTCGASHLQINRSLGLDGKASQGAIASLMIGDIVQTDLYGSAAQDIVFGEEKPKIPLGVETNLDSTDFVIPLSGEVIKDDGAKRFETLDDIVSSFDIGTIGLTDVACGVCLGSGYVGGYAPVHANRQVVPVNKMTIVSGTDMNIDAKPWSAQVHNAQVSIAVPHGVVGIDSIQAFNNSDPVRSRYFIEGEPLNRQTLLGRRGQTVTLTLEPNGATITHIEVQLITSDFSIHFELPKINDSPDLSVLDSTNPFQILLSPHIPKIGRQDVIVEPMYGKHLVVGGIVPWHTLGRQHLGYEAEVRVAQPQEIYTILPNRGQHLPNKTTLGVVSSNRNIT